jgi:hypothetical protein
MRAAYLAVILAAASFGCSTEEVHRDVFILGVTGGPAAWEAPASVSFYMYRNDLRDGDDEFRDLPSYRLRFDGLDVVWDTGEYLSIGAGNSLHGPRLPAGDHVLEVVSDDASLPAAGGNLSLVSNQLHHVVVFGDPHAPQFRLFRDDPATVPAGATHLRLLNGLDTGQPITPARCMDDAPSCVAIGAQLAFGELFEIDEPAQTPFELVWGLANGDPNVRGPMATGLHSQLGNLPDGEPSPFMLTIPLHVTPATSPTCPGCTSSHQW